MKAIAAGLLLGITGLLAQSAWAGPTSELKVSGIIKPPACQASFSGGGVIDYGVIWARTLVKGQNRQLGRKTMVFSLTCDAPLKVGIDFNDNRKASRVPGIVAGVSANSAERFNFGLGTVAGSNVGGYALAWDPASTRVDGAAVDNVYRLRRTGEWVGGAAGLDDVHTFSFARPGSFDPIGLRTFSATLVVQAVLNKPENLPLSQEIPIDGSATIEITYL